MRCTCFKASLSCTSEKLSKGSRFERIVPEKRTGSCGMIVRRVRRSCSFMVDMSIPSTAILPWRALRKRKRARERVDLPKGGVLVPRLSQKSRSFYVPAPVLPTTPTL
jgi:hypothetical protein